MFYQPTYELHPEQLEQAKRLASSRYPISPATTISLLPRPLTHEEKENFGLTIPTFEESAGPVTEAPATTITVPIITIGGYRLAYESTTDHLFIGLL
jgi:hypothetical protein